ncbi:MAG: hypothetical protein JXB26_12705 [Candidatus Aminicenantes bacterium]|nr:hypothetical protein [Candidatus Aminicenantes bacterium]
MNRDNTVAIVNPKAANRKWPRRKRLRRYIRKHLQGQLIHTRSQKKYTHDILKNLDESIEYVIAVGGDGTVAEVIQGIVRSERSKDITFGIIPYGSGNAICYTLGIPKNIRKSIKHLKKENTKEIDLIDIEGQTGVFASIGAAAQIVYYKLQRKIPGLLGHLWAARTMAFIKRKHLDIEMFDGVDDKGNHFETKKFQIKALDCIVNKTKHFGYSWRIAPKAEIDDGYLDISFFQMPGIIFILGFAWIYSGFFHGFRRHYKAKRIIVMGKDLFVQYNGELFGKKNKVDIKVLPKALRIITKKKNRSG